MAQIVLDQVDKVYQGGVKALDDLNLGVGEGEFMVLVGLSGSGKSTALRSIAGLEEITGGTISIGERVVNHLPPKDRDIAMVGQSSVLYPRMTAEENLSFGLKLRNVPRAEIRRRVTLLGSRSAAMPVIVSVSTVVVRSGTASLRAVAFCMPIAAASSTMSGYR